MSWRPCSPLRGTGLLPPCFASPPPRGRERPRWGRFSVWVDGASWRDQRVAGQVADQAAAGSEAEDEADAAGEEGDRHSGNGWLGRGRQIDVAGRLAVGPGVALEEVD